jgi:hypothetical protein
MKLSRGQIDKNIKILRWKIGKAEPDVIEQLTCCLARSMLIYIGTPMMAVGLWNRQEIDRIEASLYRRIMRIGNDITNAAILNTMTSIRLAGEVTYYLSREAQNEFRRQNRVTKYFDQIEDVGASGNIVDSRNDDVVMGDSGGVRLTDEERQTTTTTTSRYNEGHHRNYNVRGLRGNYRRPADEEMPRREKIFVPKVMKALMISSTANSTSIHFGMGHMCHRHNKLFTLEHIEQCD